MIFLRPPNYHKMYLSLQVLNLKWKIKKVRRKQGKGFLTKQTQQVLYFIKCKIGKLVVTQGLSGTSFRRGPGKSTENALLLYLHTSLPTDLYIWNSSRNTHFDISKPAERQAHQVSHFYPGASHPFGTSGAASQLDQKMGRNQTWNRIMTTNQCGASKAIPPSLATWRQF